MRKLSIVASIIKICIFLFCLISLFPEEVCARSGCCSHHGGVCGCGCCDGTSLSSTCAPYYPSCGGGGSDYDTSYNYAPVYSAPSCESTIGNNGSYTFTENDCSQNVQFTWDQGLNDEAFSVGISKTAGSDPGPTVDTSSRSWTFSKVKPGTWYINIKPGSDRCGWGRTWYWKIEVPQPSSFFLAKMGAYDNNLSLEGKCLKSIVSSPNIGKIDNLNKFVTPLSMKKKAKIKLTAYPLYGKAITQEVEYDPDRVVPTPPPLPTPTPKHKDFLDWLFGN